MVITSRWTVQVPKLSLQKYLFGSDKAPWPDQQAFIDAEDLSRALTFSALLLYSKRVALGLQNQGVKPGETILVYSGNDIFMPCLFLGIIMAGAIFTGASPALGPNELAYQLQDSHASVLIAADAVLDNAVKAAELSSLPRNRLFKFDGSPSAASHCAARPYQDIACWSDLLGSESDAESFQWYEPVDPMSTTCCLNYSSGTTGKFKGVEITHYSYIANAEAGMVQRRLRIQALGDGSNPSTLCVLPMYHAAAQTCYMVNAPKMGLRTYIMSAYRLDRMLQHVQDYRITDLLVAPPIVLSLVASQVRHRFDLSSLKNITCGTAPLASGLVDEVGKLFRDKRVKLLQGWGMTELTCIGSMVDPNVENTSPSSVGEVAPNCAIKVMNGSEEIREPNRRGELWFTGPNVMKGYWRNPEATHDSFVTDDDGVRWFKTGDIVYLDSYGPGANIHIVDRAKELIKVKGFQVAPAELEELLLLRQDVVDVGVIGVTLKGGEVPRAYIVRAPGSTVSADEICLWIEGRVATYKYLRGGVVFVDAIPRVPSGKILRRVLREWAQSEFDQAAPPQPKI